MAGASATMASVMPVRTEMNAGMCAWGLTSVWNSPSSTPPRTLTAPISVIAEVAGLPPVVSRSTTTKVVSARVGPSSSKVPWTADPARRVEVELMATTLGATTDKPPRGAVDTLAPRGSVSGGT